MAKPAILTGPGFQAALKNLSDADIARVEEALQIIPGCFGQPHVHADVSSEASKQ